MKEDNPSLTITHKPMETKFSTSFIVFPEHTNHMSPIIFGGKFMAELDLCAAKCVRRALYSSSKVNGAVTHKMEVTFKKPCYLGDFIIMEAELTALGEKSLSVNVKAYREVKSVTESEDSTYENPAYLVQDWKEEVAEANFVFISASLNPEQLKDKPYFLPYKAHGLKL